MRSSLQHSAPACGRLRKSKLVLVSLLAAACIGTLASCRQSETAERPKAKKLVTSASSATELSAAQKQFLTIEPVGEAEGVDTLNVPGRETFRPQAQYAVGTIVRGRVSALLVRNGQTVAAGTPLFLIDSSEASASRAALDQARVRLANAENVYRRNVTMAEKGVGLEVERLEAETKLNEARSEYERARQGVELLGDGKGLRVSVRAPASGVVMNIRVSIGSVVAPGGEALLDLGNPRELQVVAHVAESDLRRISLGADAEVQLPALGARLNAKVEALNPRVDPETRRAQVYLTPAGAPQTMRDGMLAQVSLRATSDQALLLPVGAVLIKDGKRRIVYIELPDGKYQAREVETGRIRDGRVAILKGLSMGERVVVRGALLLDSQAELLL